MPVTDWIDLPFAEAIRYLRSLAPTPKDVFETMNEESRQRAFTVARVAKLEVLQEVLSSLTEAAETGKTLDQFVKEMEFTGLSDAHLETIFRTNLQSSFGRGNYEKLTDPQLGGAFWGFRYQTVKDERVREEHAVLDGLVFATGTHDEIFPPWSFNSVLPETPVAGTFYAASKAPYSGKAVEVTTRSGGRFSVTANHPVLTPKGFVPAELLREGDHSISDRASVGQRVGMKSKVYEENTPSEAAKVFETLSRLFPSVEVRVAPEHFHGHERSRGGNVQIVGANRELLNARKAAFTKSGSNLGFSAVDAAQPLVARLGSFDSFLQGVNSSARGDMGRLHLGLALLCAHAGPLNQFGRGSSSYRHSRPLKPSLNRRAVHAESARQSIHGLAVLVTALRLLDAESRRDNEPFPEGCRFGIPTAFDTAFSENPNDWNCADADFGGQLLHRFPGLVAADEIVLVREFEFSGHVYDFTSKNSLIVSDRIGLSNCRCHPEPITRREARNGDYVSDSLPAEVMQALGESDFASPALGVAYEPDLGGYDLGLVVAFINDSGPL